MFWHSVWHSFTYVLTVLGNLSGILSDIYSNILSNILSGIYSDTSVAHCIRGWREVSVAGGENMWKHIKLTMGKSMEKPWLLRYFKDVLIMSSKVPKRRPLWAARLWSPWTPSSIRSWRASMFPSRRQGGRAVVDVDFLVSIERDLDFLWIGFLGWILRTWRNRFDLGVGLYGCPSMISRRRCHWWFYLCPIYPPCSGAIGSNPGGMEFVDWLVV